MDDASFRETIEARLMRLEDKYTELQVELAKTYGQVLVQFEKRIGESEAKIAKEISDIKVLYASQNASLNTKMNLIGAIATITAGGVITAIVAIVFHV